MDPMRFLLVEQRLNERLAEAEEWRLTHPPREPRQPRGFLRVRVRTPRVSLPEACRVEVFGVCVLA